MPKKRKRGKKHVLARVARTSPLQLFYVLFLILLIPLLVFLLLQSTRGNSVLDSHISTEAR